MNFFKKQQSVLLAALMVLLLAQWFAPEPQSSAFLQVDFWVLWLVAMTVLALPMLYLEVALAKRSKKTPILGMEELTRQSDAATFWRVSSWLAVVLLTLLVVGLVDFAATTLPEQLAKMSVNIPNDSMYWLIGLTVLAVLLSFAGQWLVVVAAMLAVAAVVVSGINVTANWQLTGTSLVEWKNAVTLALVSTGLGAGLYWQNTLNKAAQKRDSSWIVMPIWFAQVVAGVVFALFQGVNGTIANILYALAAVTAAGLLVAYLRQNLMSKSNGLFIGIGLFALALMLWSLPDSSKLMVALVSFIGFAVACLYSVFAGWQMKISHLRKSIAFESEFTYNLWRVAVRLVIPVSIILATAGLALQFA